MLKAGKEEKKFIETLISLYKEPTRISHGKETLRNCKIFYFKALTSINLMSKISFWKDTRATKLNCTLFIIMIWHNL